MATKNPGPALHLPVVQINRVLWHPAPLQHHCAMRQVLGSAFTGKRLSAQRTVVERRQGGALVQQRLQGLLLRGTRQLPSPQ